MKMPEEVLDGFREDFFGEQYLVDAIKKYLLTPEHKALLNSKDISIEDVLNGRIEGDDLQYIYKMLFDDWNPKLKANGLPERCFFGQN